MNFVACVKRVPDTASKIRVGQDGRAMDPAGVTYVVNPYDEFAVEECLRLKEKHGGTVTVLSVGPADSSKELRHCLAMGADRAVLVKDDQLQRDPLSTAMALAEALKQIPHDVVFFGKQAVDHDNAQVGLLVATLLDLPAVAEVVKVELGTGIATVQREAEGKLEVFELPVPCVLTAQKGLNEPRYASLKGIMAAKSKKLDEIAVAPGDVRVEVLKMEPPAARPEGKIVGEGAAAVPALVKRLREDAKVL